MPNTLTTEQARYVNSFRNYKKTGENIECPECFKVVYRYPSQIKKGYLYCSKDCWHKNMPDRIRSDRTYREKLIEALDDNRSKRNYSSPENRAKMSIYGSLSKPRYGADNNLWKGGIATLQNKLRQTPKYKEWRKAVYDRDNFQCQNCGTNKDLHAHHIKTFSKYPKLRYTLNNGITVCRPCHMKIHGRYIPNIGKVNLRTA